MKKNTTHKIIIAGSIILASMNFASAESISSFLKSVFDVKSTSTGTVQLVSTTTIETSTSTIESVEQDTDSSASSTDATDTPVCDIKTKLVSRNTLAKIQMKKQTEDKNKIVVSLEKVASSSDATSSKIVQEKIVKLEKEFSDIVKVENNIVDIASTTISVACDEDAVSTKLVTRNLLKIKKLEVEKDKQVDEVKVLIKKEIKNTLKSLLQN